MVGISSLLNNRTAAFGKSVSSPAFVFHWFILPFVGLIWKMLTLAPTELKKQNNFFHTSWEEEGDKTLGPRWSGNSVCKEQLRARRGVITVMWLDGPHILHCLLRQGPLWSSEGHQASLRVLETFPSGTKDPGRLQYMGHRESDTPEQLSFSHSGTLSVEKPYTSHHC